MKPHTSGKYIQIGKKNYKKINVILITSYAIAFIILLMIIIFGPKARNKEVEALANSDDPVGNLILALKEDPEWHTAREKLDELGDPLLVSLAPMCGGWIEYEDIYAYDLCEVIPEDDRSEVCKGRFFESGPHPLVFLLYDGKSHKYTYTYLNQWGPASRQPEDVEVVVCAYEYERTHYCSYSLGSEIKRIRYGVHLYVYEADTGRLLAIEEFWGSLPNCPDGTSTSYTKRGSGVPWSEVVEYLQNIYE